MINLTDKAAKQIEEILESQKLNKENAHLRVGVKGGGCSGFNYVLDLSETDKDKDDISEKNNLVFIEKGIKIVCDEKSYLYLNGVQIDFRDEIMGRGFVFDNPNATSTCGCGSSFS